MLYCCCHAMECCVCVCVWLRGCICAVNCHGVRARWLERQCVPVCGGGSPRARGVRGMQGAHACACVSWAAPPCPPPGAPRSPGAGMQASTRFRTETGSVTVSPLLSCLSTGAPRPFLGLNLSASFAPLRWVLGSRAGKNSSEPPRN